MMGLSMIPMLIYGFSTIFFLMPLTRTEAWNHHTITIHGEHQCCPWDMFFFSMIQNDPRGIHPADDKDLKNVNSYGINWDDYDNDQILDHHQLANIDDNPDQNPFVSHCPEQMTQVDVDEPGCPLTKEQILYLNSQLNSLPFIHTCNMDSY